MTQRQLLTDDPDATSKRAAMVWLKGQQRYGKRLDYINASGVLAAMHCSGRPTDSELAWLQRKAHSRDVMQRRWARIILERWTR